MWLLTRSARVRINIAVCNVESARWTAQLHRVLTKASKYRVRGAAVLPKANCKLLEGYYTQFKMSLGVAKFHVLPKARQATSTAVYCKQNRCRTFYARALPKRMMHSPTVFPGEDAPGTGKKSDLDSS